MLRKQLSLLEFQRNISLRELDSVDIEKKTNEISEVITSITALNDEDVPLLISSIVKTRHIFPGKMDMMLDFYKINPMFYDIESTMHTFAKKLFALVIVSDCIANFSIINQAFNSIIQNILESDNYIAFKMKIKEFLNENEFDKANINNLMFEIDKLLEDNELVNVICEIEQSFGPSIDFSHFYCEMLASPHWRQYEVVGIDIYAYWPSEISYHIRKETQEFLFSNPFLRKFKPLSLNLMRIDAQAVEKFPMLSGLNGSFIPYLAKPIVEFDPIEFLLVSKKETTFLYDPESLEALRWNVLNSFPPSFLRTSQELKYYAEQGVADIQLRYAKLLMRTKGSIDNLSFAYINHSAHQGNKAAQCNIGSMYYDGDLVKRDEKKAANWISLSALQDYPNAQYIMGRMHYDGLGDIIKKDIKTAMTWLKKAADNGHIDSQYEISQIFFKGVPGIIERNLELTTKWLHYAADNGHSEAQYKLGLMYRSGEGVKKNTEEVARLFRSAANQGHCEAQCRLSVMYRRGVGVEKDEIEADLLYDAALFNEHSDSSW